jgi:hypothetical protein
LQLIPLPLLTLFAEEGLVMRKIPLTVPELGLIAGTRFILGGSLALLLGHHLSPRQRKVLGWTFLLVGAASTIPLAIDVLGRRAKAREWWREMEMRPAHAV